MQCSPEYTRVIEVADPGRAFSALQQGLRESDFSLFSSAGVCQIVVRTSPFDTLKWMVRQSATLGSKGANGSVIADRSQLVYWSSRDGADTIVGVGTAHEISGVRFDELERVRSSLLSHVDSETDIRYFGGMRFDDTRAESAEWSAFGGFRFVLPRLEVQSFETHAEIRCNIVLPATAEDVELIAEQLDGLDSRANKWESGTLSPVYREDLPDKAGWTQNIEWALDAFSHTRLGKIVLARKVTFGFSKSVDQGALLRRLVDATPNCYHFLFSGQDGSAFIGASPERLFKIEGRDIWSEAVAGTRPRGATEGDDDLLRNELLLSEKDQREHQFVRQSIKDTLAGLCENLELDGRPSEMKLARGRHLVSRVRGVLSAGVDAIDLLRALHPTPAVGGHPTSDAVAAIGKLEPFDRGWYAAPIGWLSTTGAEFAVGIRSGLLFDKRLSLYSGAGIVGGSTADSEWEEIENKIVDFISVFDSDAAAKK